MCHAAGVAARVTHGTGPRSAAEAERQLQAQGLTPNRWSNGPGDTYARHEHGYEKVLFCTTGSIVFHTDTDGDVALAAGDVLVLDAGTAHAATVGPGGVECVEAAR